MTQLASHLVADAHRSKLIANVAPENWVNPQPAGRYHLAVVGGGTAGLHAAMGAAGLGAKVALIEQRGLGGECLLFGCVPSKALLASARTAAELKQAYRYGLRGGDLASIDFAAVMDRVRRVRAQLSWGASVARCQGLGVDVFFGPAQFVSPREIEIAGARLHFGHGIIATGSQPAVPDIPGLADSGFLTNETLFELTQLPKRLGVIGGGVEGCELAQAMARLGSTVTVWELAPRLLTDFDPEAAELLAERLKEEGLRIETRALVESVYRRGPETVVRVRTAAGESETTVDALLLAAGRKPSADGLGLEAIGVARREDGGVRVNDHLRTTCPNLFAIGDACLKQHSTHAADASARLAVRNALFLGPQRFSHLNIPRCVYTDPEIAQAGIDSEGWKTARVQRALMQETPRALVEDEETGWIKLAVDRATGRLRGAVMVGAQAGELINLAVTALGRRQGLAELANQIYPYPTRAEAVRQAAQAHERARMTPFLKQLMALWLAWRR